MIPRRARARLVAAATALSLFLAAFPLLSPAESASAAEYPSWDDVESARRNEAAKDAAELTGLIAGLADEVDSARAVRDQLAAEYETAQAAYDEANFAAANHQAQADEASTRANDSRAQAGRVAASLSRPGTSDLESFLLLQEGGSDGMLYRAATLAKLGQQIDTV